MLLVAVAILLTGQGLQGVLLPVRANLEQFSTLSVGFIGGTYLLGFTLGCLLGARMIRRVGHVRFFCRHDGCGIRKPSPAWTLDQPVVLGNIAIRYRFLFRRLVHGHRELNQ